MQTQTTVPVGKLPTPVMGKPVPVIEVGDWKFAGEDGNAWDYPELSHHGIGFVAGASVDAAYLRKAALDLMKLANAEAAAGW
jgi:hypothetical protein